MPVLGDAERERWRAQQYGPRLTLEGTPQRSSTLSPQGLLEELRECGQMLPRALKADIVQAGTRITEGLLDAVRDGVTDPTLLDGQGKGWPVRHALTLLAEIRAPVTVGPLLDLLSLNVHPELTGPLAHTLRSFGPVLVESALALYARATEAVRVILVEILAGSRVTDSRIRALCLHWLQTDAPFGAEMLVDYGDPTVVPLVRESLRSMPLARDYDTAMSVLAHCSAIEALGGQLLTEEQSRCQLGLELIQSHSIEYLRLQAALVHCAGEYTSILDLAGHLRAACEKEGLTRRAIDDLRWWQYCPDFGGLHESLRTIAGSEYRYAFLVDACQIAAAAGVGEPDQESCIRGIALALGVPEEQLSAIAQYIGAFLRTARGPTVRQALALAEEKGLPRDVLTHRADPPVVRGTVFGVPYLALRRLWREMQSRLAN